MPNRKKRRSQLARLTSKEIPPDLLLRWGTRLCVASTLFVQAQAQVDRSWFDVSFFKDLDQLLPSFLDPDIHAHENPALDRCSFELIEDVEERPARNYLVLVIDSWRHDYAPPNEDSEATMPFLSGLLERGEVSCLTEAYASGSWTRPSTVSLISGVLPYRHRFGVSGLRTIGPNYDLGSLGPVHKRGHLPAGLTTAEQLASLRDYRTLLVSSNYIPAKHGQARFDTSTEVAVINDQGAPVIDKFFEQLDSGEGSFYAHLHFNVAHFPRVGRTYDGRFGDLEAIERVTQTSRTSLGNFGQAPIILDEAATHTNTRYRYSNLPDSHFDEVREGVTILYRWTLHNADEAIRGLFEGLEQRGMLNDTTVFITSDHGESFYDTQQLQERLHLIMTGPGIDHGQVVYDELTHVPLCVHHPNLPAGFDGRVAQSVDIPTTILSDAGVAFTGLDGTDLFVPATQWPALRLVLSESSTTNFRKLALGGMTEDGVMRRVFLSPYEPNADQLSEVYRGLEPSWIYPWPNARSCMVQVDHGELTPCTEDDLHRLDDDLRDHFPGHPFSTALERVLTEPEQRRLERGRSIVCVYSDDPACSP